MLKITEKKEFRVNVNETLELNTQTMDAGEIFYLTLK